MNKKFCDVCEKLIDPEFWRVIMIPHNFMRAGSKEFDVCSAQCLRELFTSVAQVLEEKSPDFCL